MCVRVIDEAGMTKADVKTVAEYIQAQPPNVRPILRRVRAIIRKALPKADEQISYRIPAYKMNGYPVIFFAAWRSHYSLYPISQGLAEALHEELAEQEVEKATIRFPWKARVPAALIGRIVRFRLKESALRARIRPSSGRR
jgi:uncharacterized protein YdhG (YjbR/CyaY superfamily)